MSFLLSEQVCRTDSILSTHADSPRRFSHDRHKRKEIVARTFRP
jgi:hypothetical protein